MRLLIGTKNAGKVIEIAEALDGLPVECVGAHAHGILDDPEETGATFEENALQKARFYHARSKGMPTLADDSGILVHALASELGIHTRRWGAGPQASDAEWIAHFLDRMQREPDKRARFVCVLAYIDHEGTEHLFRGTCDGIITDTLEADYLPGLPISACFKPDGFDRVYSAMSIEQKNSTSHRGKALGQFRAYIERTLCHLRSETPSVE